VQVVDQDEHRCAGVAAAQADVVQPVVVPQSELAVGVVADAEVAVDGPAGANVVSSSATEVQPDGRAGAAGGNGGVVRETPREPHSTATLEVVGGRDVSAGLIA
jgi:hypothetical protein